MTVFVCFVGHDFQRILDGINYYREREPIEAIYLLYDKKKDRYGYASRINKRDLERVLTFAGSRPVSEGINPQSYEEVFSALYRILRREVTKNHRKVMIDVTSTPKESYGAAVTVSLMFPHVYLYVVPPAARGWYIPMPGTPEYEDWFSKVRSVKGLTPQPIYLPGHRLEQPSDDEEHLLIVLEEHGGRADSIRSIIEWCGEDPDHPAAKNKYSRLVRKLLKKGLLQEEISTKTKPVRLTGFGRVLARALREAREEALRAAPPTEVRRVEIPSYLKDELAEEFIEEQLE